MNANPAKLVFGIVLISVLTTHPLRAQDAQHAPPNPPQAPAQNLPNAPSSSSKTEPSLEDLGFSKSESQGNAKQQALLDKRTHMLKIHQRMGLITTAPLLATLHHLGQRRRQKHQHHFPRRPHRARRSNRGLILHHRLLCHPRPALSRNRNSRPHPPPQSPGLDSRPRHDPDPHPGHHGLRREKQRRKGSWHCRRSRPGSDRNRRSLRRRTSISVRKVLRPLKMSTNHSSERLLRWLQKNSSRRGYGGRAALQGRVRR